MAIWRATDVSMSMGEFTAALQRIGGQMENLVTWGQDFAFDDRENSLTSHSPPYRCQHVLPRGHYRRAHVLILRIDLRETGEWRGGFNGRGLVLCVHLLDLDRLDEPDRGISTFTIRESVNGHVTGRCIVSAVAGTGRRDGLDAESGDLCGLVLCELAARCGLLEISLGQ